MRKLRFSGNKNVGNTTLENLIRTKTNREFLGINRFTPWYYIWQVTKRFGERPSFLDRGVLAQDIERIKLFYENIGYFQVQVDTSVVEYRRKKVEVSFIINEGPASTIKTLAYSGFPLFSDQDLRIDFMNSSPITKGRINDTTYTVDRRYNALELRTEQERILDFLKNNGYASVQRDSVIALVRENPNKPAELDVQIRINPGKIYRFGDMYVSLSGPRGGNNFSEKDTLSGENFTIEPAVLHLQKDPEAHSRFGMLTREIQFKPGDVFSNAKYLRTINRYQNLGNVNVRRFGLHPTRVQPDLTRSDIPVYIELQTITKHRIRTEFFGMRRFGFGTGAGIDYTNNNVFGKSERLSLRANANFEFVSSSVLNEIAVSSQQSSVFRSFEFGADYSLPRLVFPFRSWDRNSNFLAARTRYSLAYSQSDQLLFDVNSKIQFNLQYEIQHNAKFTSFLDLLELDIVDTDPTDEFLESLIGEFGEESLELERVREDFRPQISSVIRYTFRSQRTNLVKRNFGYFSEYSAEVGGNIPFLIDRFLVTPDTLEGNLPSLFGISNNTLTYNQYVKFTADYRRYYPISETAVFAIRGLAGFAQPIGNNTTIPLNRRFFAGGSNDIRGWAPFRLGPGGISPESVPINGGDIKLAAFAEARQVFLKDVFSADWQIAWFTDAGNVWYGPRNTFLDSQGRDLLAEGRFQFDEFHKQIAVGSGFGLRFDWEFIIARFDFTFRAHDLETGWFNNKKLFFSFGIGHSF